LKSWSDVQEHLSGPELSGFITDTDSHSTLGLFLLIAESFSSACALLETGLGLDCERYPLTANGSFSPATR